LSVSALTRNGWPAKPLACCGSVHSTLAGMRT
jgi:hypothetical protein